MGGGVENMIWKNYKILLRYDLIMPTNYFIKCDGVCEIN